MSDVHKFLIAKGDSDFCLLPKSLVGHGLITGSSDSDKIETTKIMAETFSSLGVSVFLTDVKNKLSGMCIPGKANSETEEKIQRLNLKDFKYEGFPVNFWDAIGDKGLPVRVTVSMFGPILLSRLLDLNEVQKNVLSIIFKVADDTNLLLIDLKDLKSMLKYISDNIGEFSREYGNIPKQSLGTIQRKLFSFEEQGISQFFGEPSLNIMDLIRTDATGKSFVNILVSEQFSRTPTYSSFLLWLLSELFERLPEIDSLERPKIILFFDEAHLIFDGIPKALLQKIKQVMGSIGKKGVGVYFIARNPSAIPNEILDYLGNKFQHKVEAFTPQDQKNVRFAASILRPNSKFETAEAIAGLKKGEVMISLLNKEGHPSPVEKGWMLPPSSYIGRISSEKKEEIIKSSHLYGNYKDSFDRISAYEVLQDQINRKKHETSQFPAEESKGKDKKKKEKTKKRNKNSAPVVGNTKSRRTDTPVEKMAKSAMSSIGREVGRELIRGILGSLTKK